MLAACNDTTGPTGRVIGGVDFDVLFAPATSAEMAAVEADWASRQTDPVDVAVLLDSVFDVGTTLTRLLVVSHDVDGVLHVGAILAADGLTQPAPTLVYSHGGDAGVSVDDVVSLLPFLGDVASEFVWVIPSFRSERLTFGDSTWVSEGPPSPWDRDVDDALSLTEAAFDLVAAADSTRVGVLGFSRGAGVGLLMAARDERIDRVIEFFGPTDFFGPFVQDVAEEALLGTPRDLPGLAFLDEQYLQPLARGEVSIASVRSQLIRRSAALFASRLPMVQLHHGTADAVVDVSQGQALIDAMSALGRGEPDFEAYLYEGGTHNPLTLAGSITRARAFLEALR